MPRTQDDYNPFDPYAEDEFLRRRRTPTYIPTPITGLPAEGDTTTDTGIPYVPPREGGFTGNERPRDVPRDTSTVPQVPAPPQPSTPAAPLPPTVNTTPAAPSYAQYAMPGWDQAKWTNPSHTSIKYQAGRIMSQFDPTAIRQNPLPLLNALRAAGLNATLIGDDKIDFGDGYGPIDIITSDGQWTWIPDSTLTQTTAQPATSPAVTPFAPAATPFAPARPAAPTANDFIQALYQQATQAMTTGQPAPPPAAPSLAPPPAPEPPPSAPATPVSTVTPAEAAGGRVYDEAIRRMVLQLMRQKPVDMNDPVYAKAIAAYSQQQQRAKERERNAIAERAAAEGTLNTGGFSDRILGAEQAQGEAEALFAGNLAVRELERQRDEIMQALTIGAGLMTEEDRLALQEKLGLINAAIQQQSVVNQNSQFNQNLGWQQDMFQYGANQGWWQ